MVLTYLVLSGLAILINWPCEKSRHQAAIVSLLICGTGVLTPSSYHWFTLMAAADLVAAFFILAKRAPEYRTITMLILMDGLFQLVAGADAWLGWYVLWDAYSIIGRTSEYAALMACILLSPVTVRAVEGLIWRGRGGYT